MNTNDFCAALYLIFGILRLTTLANQMTIPSNSDAGEETSTISFVVKKARPVDGKTLFALVDVEVTVEGVIFVICGVQARRLQKGGTSIHLPTYKAVDGSWQSAIELPEAMRVPLFDAVLGHLVDEKLARKA